MRSEHELNQGLHGVRISESVQRIHTGKKTPLSKIERTNKIEKLEQAGFNKYVTDAGGGGYTLRVDDGTGRPSPSNGGGSWPQVQLDETITPLKRAIH